MDLGDIGAALLEPLEQLTDIATEAIAALGTGVEWTGEQIEKFAFLVGVLNAKLEELQASARDDDAADPATS